MPGTLVSTRPESLVLTGLDSLRPPSAAAVWRAALEERWVLVLLEMRHVLSTGFRKLSWLCT